EIGRGQRGAAGQRRRGLRCDVRRLRVDGSSKHGARGAERHGECRRGHETHGEDPFGAERVVSMWTRGWARDSTYELPGEVSTRRWPGARHWVHSAPRAMVGSVRMAPAWQALRW